MATTEIEKLERRYAENPQGLTFAPLAEVHRKNGEVARALELLRAGLELHPNYIPASIVLGRCHWDMGDLPAAEAAFAHVLRLDDENVIALKSLADINERLERFADAQRWLNRLISVDRSNEEARQQLARLEAIKQQPAPAAEAKAVPAAPEPVSEEPAPPPTQASPEPMAPPAPPAPQPPEPEPVTEAPLLDLTAELAEPQPAEAAPPEPAVLQFLDTSEPVNPNPPPEHTTSPVEEPAPLPGLISQEFVPPKDGAYHLHPELSHDFGSSDDNDSDDLQVETSDEVELHSTGGGEFRVPNAAEDFMEAGSSATGSPPEAPAFEPAPREAPAREVPPPEEPAFQLAPQPTARKFYSVRQTKGQSVGAFFQGLLSARPPGSSPGTIPAAAGQGPEAAAQQDTGVSFDDFFGAANSASSPSKEDADPSRDDLDQFQSWLQNLKR
jgi:tetratricopeptide repeat protein